MHYTRAIDIYFNKCHNPNKAIKQYEEIIALKSSHPETIIDASVYISVSNIYLNEADQKLKNSNNNEAIDTYIKAGNILSQLYNKHHEAADIYCKVAGLIIRKGQFSFFDLDKAVSYYQKALKLDPEHNGAISAMTTYGSLNTKANIFAEEYGKDLAKNKDSTSKFKKADELLLKKGEHDVQKLKQQFKKDQQAINNEQDKVIDASNMMVNLLKNVIDNNIDIRTSSKPAHKMLLEIPYLKSNVPDLSTIDNVLLLTHLDTVYYNTLLVRDDKIKLKVSKLAALEVKFNKDLLLISTEYNSAFADIDHKHKIEIEAVNHAIKARQEAFNLELLSPAFAKPDQPEQDIILNTNSNNEDIDHQSKIIGANNDVD